MWWSTCILQWVEHEEVEKTRAKFHRKPQPNDSISRATDFHSGGHRFESSWWTLFLNINTFCTHIFLKFSFDNTITWHSKQHISKRDLSEIEHTLSRNSNMLIANWYLLLFIDYRHWCSEKTVNSCCIFLSKPCIQQWLTTSAVGSIPPKAKLLFQFLKHIFSSDHNCLSFCSAGADCILCIQAILMHRWVRSTLTMIVLNAVSYYL